MERFTLQDLPIFPYLENVVNFMKDNKKGAILGPTGIGKSLGIVANLITIYPNMTYYLSVPNINQAKFLSKRQKILSPNVKISYAGEFNLPTKDSQIVYATSEYILNLFFQIIERLNSGEKVGLFAGHILFIDEAYLSSVENYMVIKLWHYLEKVYGNKEDPVLILPRLYLLSSALDQIVSEEFEKYSITLSHHKIGIKYTKDYEKLDKRMYNDLSAYILNEHISKDIKGVFMVFLPGQREIQNLIAVLNAKIEERKATGITILPAYGDLPNTEINKIFKPIEGRKIVVTTNIFQSVVTIPNVVVVFDTMYEKRYNLSGNRKISVLISKISADQRAGRTGRTNDGECYRMCSKQTFDQLEEFTPLDIFNVPIEHLLIKLIIAKISSDEIFRLFPVEIRAKIPNSIRFLKDIDIINDKGITDIGKFYNEMKVLSPRVAGILYYWMKTDASNKYAGLILSLLINNYNDYYLNYNWDAIKGSGGSSTVQTITMNSYKEQYFKKFLGQSDLHTYMNIWLKLLENCSNFSTINIRQEIQKWCEANSIKAKKMITIHDMSENLMVKLKSLGYTDIMTSSYNTNDTINQMIPIIKKLYYDKEFLLIERYYKRLADSPDRYILSDENVNSYKIELPKRLISFSEFLPSEGKSGKILFSLNIDPNDNRIFTYNVKKFDTIIPRRANPADFKGVKEIIYIKYPAINYDKVLRGKPIEPEATEQNFILIGQKFPFL